MRKTSSPYFSEVFIELKLALRLVPMPLTAVRITMLKPTAIRQYSMAVAPDSSLRNLEINCCIQNSCAQRLASSATPANLNSIGCEYIDEEPERRVTGKVAIFGFPIDIGLQKPSALAPYSAMSTGVAGPASGLSSIRIMQSEAATSMTAAAPNTNRNAATMSAGGIELTGPGCSPESEISAPSAASRMALNTATVKEAIRARKKFTAPVTVPTCERATAFCAETVETGNAVPRPTANIESSTSNSQSGIGASARTAPVTAPQSVPTMATRL